MTTWSVWAAAKAEIVDRLKARPELAHAVLDGVPWRAEDVAAETVWVDNGTVELSIDPRALGSNGSRVAQSFTLPIRVQVIGRDSGVDVRAAEARLDELVDGVLDMIWTDGMGVTVDVTGWTVRGQLSGMSLQSGPMEHGGYSAQAAVDLLIEATRC